MPPLPPHDDSLFPAVPCLAARQSSDPSDLMGRGMTPVSIVESLLEGLGGVGAITYKRPEFLCHCSDERVYTALKLLEKSEVRLCRRLSLAC